MIGLLEGYCASCPPSVSRIFSLSTYHRKNQALYEWNIHMQKLDRLEACVVETLGHRM